MFFNPTHFVTPMSVIKYVQSSASTNANFSLDFRSGAGHVQKGLQQNPVSVTGAQDENWRESNMADSSSHTETSTDMDPDDKNYKVIHLKIISFLLFIQRC